MFSFVVSGIPAEAPFTNIEKHLSQHGKVITSIIECVMKVLILSSTFFKNWLVSSSRTLPGMWLLIRARIKVKLC